MAARLNAFFRLALPSAGLSKHAHHAIILKEHYSKIRVQSLSNHLPGELPSSVPNSTTHLTALAPYIVAIHGQDSQKQGLAPAGAATEHAIMMIQHLKSKPQSWQSLQPA